MNNLDHHLYCLPSSLSMEAPSSWISRAALSQGETTTALLDHLGINRDMDIDIAIALADQERIRKIGGLPEHHLDLSIRVLRNLVRSKCDLTRFLMQSNPRGQPRFRFCPYCLSWGPTPSFPIHWRFAAFRFCPDHDCMLEEQCHACKADINGAVSLINAGPKGSGIALLRQCTTCGADLRKVPVISQHEAFSLMGSMEQKLMRNGRAVLAALFTGRVVVSDTPGFNHGLSKLDKLDRMKLLPNSMEWNSTELLKRKLVRRFRQHAKEWGIDQAQINRFK